MIDDNLFYIPVTGIKFDKMDIATWFKSEDIHHLVIYQDDGSVFVVNEYVVGAFEQLYNHDRDLGTQIST